MGQVLVAYAEGDAEIGARVAAALETAGLTVERAAGAPSLKAEKARFDAADWVALVWSRRTAAEAGLCREAAAAAARGRLALARADSAAAPPSLRTRVSIPVPRANPGPGANRLARELARGQQKRMKPMIDTLPTPQSTWKGALLLAVLLAGVAFGAAWVSLGGSPAPALMALLKSVAS
jgi:hypothetical protein